MTARSRARAWNKRGRVDYEGTPTCAMEQTTTHHEAADKGSTINHRTLPNTSCRRGNLPLEACAIPLLEVRCRGACGAGRCIPGISFFSLEACACTAACNEDTQRGKSGNGHEVPMHCRIRVQLALVVPDQDHNKRRKEDEMCCTKSYSDGPLPPVPSAKLDCCLNPQNFSQQRRHDLQY